MPAKYIHAYGRRYYYYDTYEEWHQALKNINYYKRRQKKYRSKLNYYVIKREKGYLFPQIVYDIYFDKIIRLGF